MGLEEHLLGMFKGDFEFHEGAAASHLGHGAASALAPAPAPEAAAMADGVAVAESPVPRSASTLTWEIDAEKELGKIPFFVRGKARKNTERFAAAQGLARITKDTLYEAKAHYGR